MVIIIITIANSLTARVVGAQQMISNEFPPFFSLLHCPLGRELQACPFPDVVFPPLLLSALSSSPFTVPCKMVLARPDERKACPYHCSLRLFTMVRRPSCRPIACWTLAMIGLWSDYFWSDHLNTEKISRKVVGEYESTCECLGLQLWFSIWLGLTRVSFVGSFFY